MPDFSRYTNYMPDTGVSSVVFGANSTILEVELNEMQEIQKHYMSDFLRSVIGNGITDMSKMTYVRGTGGRWELRISNCYIICNGYFIYAAGLALPINSGTAYLWVWEEEADHNSQFPFGGNVDHIVTISNWIKDDRANNETTRRKVVRYKLSNTIPQNPEYSYMPVAKIVGTQMIKLINEVNPNKVDYTDDVYGVEVDWSNNTSVRLAGSIGKTGGTDHDNIMAFNRRKCNITDSGIITAYYGDAGYTESGRTTQTITTNGMTVESGTRVHVMIEQNKFYYKVVPLKLEKISDGIGYKVRKARYYISDTPKDGFKVHPAFIKNDHTEVDKIYIASYEASVYNTYFSQIINDPAEIEVDKDTLVSIANTLPMNGNNNKYSISDMRQLASRIGYGWQLKDFTIVSMDILLFLIEYATLNSQNIIGPGHTHGNNDDTTMNWANITGATSSFGNGTGTANGDNGFASIIYRGEENVFGNMWEIIDGLNINNRRCYWTNYGFVNGSDSTPYKPCGFTMASGSGYTTAFGYSTDCDFAFIPAEVSQNDNANNVIGDYAWISEDHISWRNVAFGGGWDHASKCGICSFNTFISSTKGNNNVGGRIVYVPLDY